VFTVVLILYCGFKRRLFSNSFNVILSFPTEATTFFSSLVFCLEQETKKNIKKPIRYVIVVFIDEIQILFKIYWLKVMEILIILQDTLYLQFMLKRD